MSGEAYGHVENFDPISIPDDDLSRLADRLAGLGFAPDIAVETRAALLDLRAADVRWTAVTRRCGPVWRALARLDSYDTSNEDELLKALAAYRGLD